MGRLQKELTSLPTIKMRGRVYARIVRMALCPKEGRDKSCANLMDGVIKAEVEELTRSSDATLSLVAKKVRSQLGYYEGSFVSSGRWKNWWDGAKPDPSKIDVLELLLPNNKAWFSSGFQNTSMVPFEYSQIRKGKKSQNAFHPLYNFLHAVDLWAGRKDCRIEAIEHLLHIQETWRPRQTLEGNMKLGWYIPLQEKKAIDADVVLNHFDMLLPSSIITFMLVSGASLKIDQTPYFTRWTFDLVSAALATEALLQSYYFDSPESGDTAITAGGLAIDAMGFVFNVYISKGKFYQPSLISDVVGDSFDLKEIISSSLDLFQSELSAHGISRADLMEVYPSHT